MQCSTCGQPLDPGATICRSCGATVGPAAVFATAPVTAETIAPARPRSRRALIVAASAALIVVLIGGSALAFSPVLFGSGFKAASYMPKDTWFVAGVTMRPGLIEGLNTASLVDAFTKQPGFNDAIRALQSSASASNVDVQKDIVPLLDGEITFGVGGPVTTPTGVLFVHTSDPEKLLKLLASSAKLPEPKDRYKDGLRYTQRSNGQLAEAIASPKGWVVVGSTTTIAEQAFDRIGAGGDDSLGASARFKAIIDRLPGDRLGFVYWDNAQLMSDPSMQRSLAAVPPQFQGYAAALNSRLAIAIQAASDGLELRWESIPDKAPPAGTDQARGSALAAMGRLPNDTLFAVGGDSLPSLISGLDTALNAALQSAGGANAPRIEFQFTKWLGGEFAFGIGSGTQGSPDVLFAAKVKDAGAAATDLSAVDRFVNPRTAQFQGDTFKQAGSGASAFYYGIGGDWLYASSARAARLIPPHAGRTDGLTTAANFALVKRAVLDNGVVMYVDVEGARHFAEDSMTGSARSDYDAKAKVFLQPMRAFGGSVHTDASGEVHGVFLLAIKQ